MLSIGIYWDRIRESESMWWAGVGIEKKKRNTVEVKKKKKKKKKNNLYSTIEA